MKRLKILFTALLLMLIADLGFGQTNHIVFVSNNTFSPSEINISVGDTVTWKWVEGTHSTTSDSTVGNNVWNADINQNDSVFSFKITSPGVHKYYCRFHGGPNGAGMSGSIIASIAVKVDKETEEPSDYKLYQNYPNPFNPTTRIQYRIPDYSFVTLKVFNALGNEVATLINEPESAGLYSITFNGKDLTSGIYYFKLVAGNFTRVKKMILLK